MSTVDEWARNRAWDVIEGIEEVYRGEWQKVENVDERREYYAQGLTDLAALLLSDEAVEAAIVSIRGMGPDTLDREPAESWEVADARRILQAALTKITEDKE